MPRQFLLALVLIIAIILPSSCNRSRSEENKETVRSFTPVPTWTSTPFPVASPTPIPTIELIAQPRETVIAEPIATIEVSSLQPDVLVATPLVENSELSGSEEAHRLYLEQFVAVANEIYSASEDDGIDQYEIRRSALEILDNMSAPEGYADLMRLSYSLTISNEASAYRSGYQGNINEMRLYFDEAILYFRDYLSYRNLYLDELDLTSEQAGFKE